jgi:hypothetical protein
MSDPAARFASNGKPGCFQRMRLRDTIFIPTTRFHRYCVRRDSTPAISTENQQPSD